MEQREFEQAGGDIDGGLGTSMYSHDIVERALPPACEMLDSSIRGWDDVWVDLGGEA
jgi:hypothetical protein